MIVKMLRHVHGWYCECCGCISDTELSVEVGTHWTGFYYDDGHFGESCINEEAVEADIAQALGLAQEYATRCKRRAQLDNELGAALDAAKTDEEENAAYEVHAAACEGFAEWLALWGHELIEESTYEHDEYEYDTFEE